MPVVKLPDGTLVELPDTVQPAPGMLDNVLGFAKDSGKAVVRGAANAGLGIMDALGSGALDPNTLKPMPHPLVEKGRAALDRALPPEEGPWYRGMEGLGSGVLGGANALRVGAANAAGNVAGDLTDKFLESQNPTLRKIGSLLVNMGVSMGAGAGLAPNKRTTAADDVARDTGTLTGVGLNRVGPEVDASRVANQTADAANAHIRSLERQNSDNFASTVQGVNVRGRDAAQIYRDLNALAAQESRPEAAAALREVANQLVHQNGQQFITSVPELSLALKRLKENPPGPNASTGRTISSGDLASAIRTAEGMLGTVAPEFAAANNIYRAGKQQVINPAKEGPVGRVADRNPNNPAPTPVGRLGNIVNDRAPGDIPTTVQQLQAQGASPQDIARALLQKSTEEGSLRPGIAAFGQPGSLQEGRMDALVGSAGRNPAQVRAPFRAADTLAETLPPGGNLGESVSLHPGGVTARISSFMGRRADQHVAKDSYKAQIAELMATASPQELEQLQRLSMFDPNIRAMLTAVAGLNAVNNQKGGQ